MNNFGIALKKFFTNKNVVTIIGVIAIVVILYFAYQHTVKKSVDPINVPVAKTRMISKHLITPDDISYKKVSRVVVSDNVIQNSSLIINKVVNINVTIPEGSMFYSEWLVDKEDYPGEWIESADFDNGEEVFYFSTDTVKTFGNSVLPHSYVDIYMKAEDENGNLLYGKLLENIEVLVVHDGNGKNVFADANAIGAPSYLGFALSAEHYRLLKKATMLHNYGIELILAPQGTTPQKIDGEVTVLVGSETLKDYIIANTADLPDEHIEQKVVENNNTLDNILNNSNIPNNTDSTSNSASTNPTTNNEDGV